MAILPPCHAGIDGAAGSFTRYYKALADEGYIFVFQDIRGKFKSEGEFVMQRPAARRETCCSSAIQR